MEHYAQRFAHTQVLSLQGPLDRVFPLFGPMREKEWAADWDPTLLYSDSELGDSPGTIFLSRHAGQPDTIWYVMRFDAAQHIAQYLRVTPGLYLAVVEVRCESAGAERTTAAVTYTFTALSEAGATALHHLASHHGQDVAHWADAINVALRV